MLPVLDQVVVVRSYLALTLTLVQQSLQHALAQRCPERAAVSATRPGTAVSRTVSYYPDAAVSATHPGTSVSRTSSYYPDAAVSVTHPGTSLSRTSSYSPGAAVSVKQPNNVTRSFADAAASAPKTMTIFVPCGFDASGQAVYRPQVTVQPAAGIEQSRSPSIQSQAPAGAPTTVSRQPSATVSRPPQSNSGAPSTVSRPASAQGPSRSRTSNRQQGAANRGQTPGPNRQGSSGATRARPRSQSRGRYVNRYAPSECNCGIDFGGDKHKESRHLFKFHKYKFMSFKCRSCHGYFWSPQDFVSHVDFHHKDEIMRDIMPASDELMNLELSNFMDTHMGAYMCMPFCKNCLYMNPGLFQEHLGCYCPGHRPVPGTSLDNEDWPLVDVPKRMVPLLRYQTAIPDNFVCRGPGYSHEAPPVPEEQSEEPLPPSILKSGTSIVQQSPVQRKVVFNDDLDMEVEVSEVGGAGEPAATLSGAHPGTPQPAATLSGTPPPAATLSGTPPPAATLSGTPQPADTLSGEEGELSDSHSEYGTESTSSWHAVSVQRKKSRKGKSRRK